MDTRIIDIESENEVRYWLAFLGTTRNELYAAVSAVGQSAQEVRNYLRAKGNGIGGSDRRM
jgi:hypothetical protein